MRILSPEQCAEILGQHYLSKTDAGEPTLSGIVAQQPRLAAGPSKHVERLGYFAESLIRWLPNNAGRLLWVTNWGSLYGNPYKAFEAMRLGLGEHRELKAAPAMYAGPHSWTWDPEEMEEAQRDDAGLLVAALFMIMGAGWDAWLMSELTTDAIEFWEGNILFYSRSKTRLVTARKLLRTADARMTMV